MSPLRVAMMIHAFPTSIGGAERQLERLGPLLHRRGVDACVLGRRGPGQPEHDHVAGLEVRRVFTPATPAAASIAYSFGGGAALARLHPDVVHVHGLLSPATAALVGTAFRRTPVVAKVLSSGPAGDLHSLLRKPLGRARLRRMARRFAAFIAISGEIERELLDFGIPAARIARIPNGVDADVFRPPAGSERARVRQRLGLRRDGPIALYCGRFEPPKRVDLLIETFRRVGTGSLLLVGEGSEQERIRRLAADPELAGRVEVRPTMADVTELYRAVDLYLSASLQEGLSGAALEAMASGLCVAAVPSSGMRELLKETGVLLPASGDPDELSAAVDPLLRDGKRRERLASAARVRVATYYSLDRVADQLLDLYAQILDRQGSSHHSAPRDRRASRLRGLGNSGRLARRGL